MRRGYEDAVRKQQVQLQDAEVDGQYAENDGDQRDEKPIERLTPRVAHAVDNTSTLTQKPRTLTSNGCAYVGSKSNHGFTVTQTSF